MTRRDMVLRASKETGLMQKKAQEVLQKYLDYIFEALAKGEKVELRNFGVFEVKTRKARVGRNPHQPAKDVPIPERNIVKFRAGKELKEAVMKLPLMDKSPEKSPPQEPGQ